MKKTFTFLLILLTFLFAGCSDNSEENYSEAVTLEVGRINSDDGSKIINITYPIVGGLSRSETVTMINSSIQNYVEIQQREFENALSGTSNTETPINQEFIDESGENQEADNSEGDSEQAASESEEDTENNITPDEETAETTSEEGAADTGTDNGETDGQISLTMNFEITYNKNNILNIVESYEKSLGKGTENIIGQQSFVFDLGRGVPLTLGEVFQFEGEFPEIINSGIEEQIQEDNSLITFENQQGFSGISKDANFYFDDENLYIFYNALEIGPEKNLIPTFHFPLKDLEPYLIDEYVDIFKN